MTLTRQVTIFLLCAVHLVLTLNTNCHEKALEKREQQANVVITGTVRDLYPDEKTPYMYKGEVEIKRVIKGSNVITIQAEKSDPVTHNRMVMVDGFGDPKICESQVNPNDTRIFLLSSNGHGELKLNSSLMRITLNNIEHTDAVVLDKPFVERPEPKETPCDMKYCAYGAVCRVNSTNEQPYCKCIETCRTAVRPVCGSDGVTYDNECLMRQTSCVEQKRIKLRSKGKCKLPNPCDHMKCKMGSVCTPSLDGKRARCQCPRRCQLFGDPEYLGPVCGSDGRDYTDFCELSKRKCETQKSVSIMYTGICDPCKTKKCSYSQTCQLDSTRKPVCKCDMKSCPEEIKEVCANNGRTYSNKCFMKIEGCKKGKTYRVLHKGPCDGSEGCGNLECRRYAECMINSGRPAQCECPTCESRYYRPVCGSDGVTYENSCDLMKKSCKANKDLTIKFVGTCADGGLCVDFKCAYGAECKVRNNKPICECPKCSEEHKPVCGTDGMTYANKCKLDEENCKNQKMIHVSYQGACSFPSVDNITAEDGCEKLKCEHYSTCVASGGKAKCVCRSTCTFDYKPVCGTDGIGYNNECELELASCKKQQLVLVSYKGKCDKCKDVVCENNAVCDNGVCVCPKTCPNYRDVVCASNGVTYDNRCMMQRAACELGIKLTVVEMEECEEDMSGSGSGTLPTGDVCDDSTCRYGGICHIDERGVPGCQCNFSCPAIRSPVCGSDGRMFASKCQLSEESCLQQKLITIQSMDNCDDYYEEACDGNEPLRKPSTGEDYDCDFAGDSCPEGSYCHKGPDFNKCCPQEVKTCNDSDHGCCPDGKTASLGPGFKGCPSTCNCNSLGSLSARCNSQTGQCACKPGVGGRHCDRCEPGYWGLRKIKDGNSGCLACKCNIYGSERDDCEQETGMCMCRTGIKGHKCDRCDDGIVGPGGCISSSQLPASCSQQTCLHGATCMEEGGQARCICNMKCSASQTATAVCASNGKTYKSRCDIKQFACRLQQDIRFVSDGPCRGLLSMHTTQHMGISKATPEPATPEPATPEPTTPEPATPEPEVTGSTPAKPMLTTMLATRDAKMSTTELLEFFEKEARTTPTHMKTTRSPMTTDAGVLAPSFSGNSFLQLNFNLNAKKQLTIEMELLSLKPDGLLMYCGLNNKDFISLSLVDSFVEFRYNLGSGVNIIRSPSRITLGVFTHVVAKRQERDGVLMVGGQPEISGSSKPSARELNLHGADIFLGNVDALSKFAYKHAGTSKGFEGCIKAFTLRGSSFAKTYGLQPSSEDIVTSSNLGTRCRSGLSGCLSAPCQNGGSCADNEDGTYTCKCPPGYQDHNCETALNTGMFVPEFSGESFIERSSDAKIGKKLTVEVWFKATKPDGLIFYKGQRSSGSGDYVALNLVDGYLRFMYNLGSGAADIRSTSKIELNHWHKVIVKRASKEGSLDLDGIIVLGESKGSTRELNAGLPLYIGGLRSYTSAPSGTAITTGFHGAIQRFYINGKWIEDLRDGATGLAKVETYRGEPCSKSSCSNGGLCVPMLDKYDCRCTDGFSGMHCDLISDGVDGNSPVKFDGSTWLEYSNLGIQRKNSETRNDISLRFKTSSQNGLLLIIHKSNSVSGDYLTLAVVGGRLELSYNLGMQSAANLHILRSGVRVNDGKWHKVHITRNRRKANLMVDNKSPVTDVSKIGATMLDTDGKLFIGGKKNLPTGLPAGYYQGFRGCITDVKINSYDLHMARDQDSIMIKPLNFCE